jgi:hypothetical protein
MPMRVTPEMHTPRRFDRGSWIAIGIVLVMMVASVAATVANLVQVGDGCVYDYGNAPTTVFGACVGGWATPLRAGDELLAVAGVTWADRSELVPPAAPPGWVDDGTLRYTVRRAGRTLDLDVPLHRMGWDGLLRAFGYGLARQAPDWNTVVFLGTMVIFALAPRVRAAQLLLVAIGGLTVVTALAWPGLAVSVNFAPAPVRLFTIFLTEVWGWLFVPTILLLVLSFPRRVWPLARRPRLTVALIYGLPLAAIAASFITMNFVFGLAALGLGALCVVVAIIVITGHTLLRVRDPVVRAQSAWLALGLAIGLAFWPLFWVLIFVFSGLLPAVEQLPWWLGLPLSAIVNLAFPVCLGIAITRYRLFDIEIIIRRTLVYSILTLTLGLVYVGCIVVSRTLVAPLTGGSELAIVASTLAIAALFNPLRRRIQNLIDKRFYRRKYNAANVLAAFGATVRDETDLEQLTAALMRVVETTMQPEFVGLWLRDTPVRGTTEKS